MHAGWHRLALTLLCVTACTSVRADSTTDIPLVGRPDFPFSEASGSFKVKMRAAPTKLAAEDRLTLTLTVAANGQVYLPPQRIDLRQLPAFAENFHIEETEAAPRQTDLGTWEFVYRIRPRSTAVREVPGLPFVYYNPDIPFPSRRFQVDYTDAVPIEVTEHAVFPVRLAGPEEAFQLADGPEVLAHQSPWKLPGPLVLGLVALVPPLLCVVWYVAWRRLYPDAARRARIRRSWAARQALQALRRTGRLTPQQQADLAAGVAAQYLRNRLDLAPAEPTPDEIAEHMKRMGCSSGLTERAAAFFRSCDSARFGPFDGTPGPDLPADATSLILAVEDETWAAHS
jgi:hypothetical protein